MRSFTKIDTNICKGIAIVMMYIHHLFYSSTTPGMDRVYFWLLTEDELIFFAKACKICVAIFVFLSGYDTYVSMMRKQELDLVSYAKRRYFSMMTGFWIIFADVQLLSYFTSRTRESVYGESFILRCWYTLIDGLGLAHAFGTPTYNATWWYMSYAVLLVFLLPILILASKKIGFLVLPIAVLLPRMASFDMGSTFFRYLLPLLFGIICAQYQCFERIDQVLKKSWGLKIICCAILVLFIGGGMIFIRKIGYTSLMEAPVTLAICLLVYLYLSKIPLLSKILSVFGEYSLYMFLTHTFVKAYFFREFTYSFRYPLLILLVLLLDTLVLAILIRAEERAILKVICKVWAKVKEKIV
jgi:hypothetical protein